MSPEYNQREDRSALYFRGVLLPSGIAVPGARPEPASPGPGHYYRDTGIGSDGKGRPASAPKSRSTSQNASFGSAPRNVTLRTMIRDDVVFHGKGHDVDIGPGQYTLPNTFCKKSFNVRVGDGNRKGLSRPPSAGASTTYRPYTPNPFSTPPRKAHGKGTYTH